MNQSDHVKIARLQNQIMGHLGLNSEQIVFDHREDGGQIALDLITVNPHHAQSFLFKSLKGTDRVDALEKALQYVESYKERENCYTLQWSRRGERDLHTSYFRGGNIYDVLQKFHHNREQNTYIIYSVVLSPVS